MPVRSLPVALILLTVACRSAPEPAAERPMADADVDSGASAEQSDSAQETTSDLSSAAGATEDAGTTDPGQPVAGPALTFVNNQLMVKLKSALSADELTGLVEETTGAQLEQVRSGPVQIRLLVFKPTEPERTAEDLAALQASLEATGAFEYVQPNRLYEAKSPGDGPRP